VRRLLPLVLLVLVAACPSYDRYGYVSTEKGLIPGDQYAKYGPEQAISVAIGREFGRAYKGRDSADFVAQADSAVAYAKKFSSVTSVVPDPLGYRLVVNFADGWSSQINPITDGKNPDQTPNLPAR
jgi:hypothetical protein